MFIIDFDDTLFDTHSFKQLLPNLSKNLYTENEKIKNLLFPDAVYFLEFLKETKQPLVLLSFGEFNFQKAKINSVGLDKFFDAIHIVSESKESAVEKILNEFNSKYVWFINDKIEETKTIIQSFPQLKPILKMSPRFSTEEYKLSAMPYFKTLTEIKQYVEQQIK